MSRFGHKSLIPGCVLERVEITITGGTIVEEDDKGNVLLKFPHDFYIKKLKTTKTLQDLFVIAEQEYLVDKLKGKERF